MSEDAGTGGGVADGAGAGEVNFQSTLGEDFSANEAFADFKDVNGLAKAYMDTKQMVGASLRVPGEDAGTEDWNSFYQTLGERTGNRVMPRPNDEDGEAMTALYSAMGRPSEAGGYTLPELEGGVGIPDDRKAMLQGAAHEAGLTSTQFNSVMTKVMEADNLEAVNQKMQHDSDMKTLRDEYGLAYDDKIKNAELIKNTFFKFVDVPVEQLGAFTVKAFAELADKFGGEAGGLVNGQGVENVGLTPADAQIKIDEMMRNKQSPYWDQTSPAHGAAKAKMRELHVAAAVGQTKDKIVFTPNT